MYRHLFCVRGRLKADSGAQTKRENERERTAQGKKGHAKRERQCEASGKHYRDRGV